MGRKKFRLIEFVCAVWLLYITLFSMFPILKSQYITNIAWITAIATFLMGLTFWLGEWTINKLREIE